MPVLRNYIIIAMATLLLSEARAQTCPYNIDFEEGSFTGWDCFSGFVSSLTGINEVNWTGFSPDPGRHLLIQGPDTSRDYYGNFPRLCPNGSGFSVKLGNDLIGGQAEGISYYINVPSGVTNYSIFFHYAVVLEDPNHFSEQQPRFRARIVNAADGSPIQCVNFDFTASASLPGFLPSPVKPTVLYKDWTPITLNLTAFAGQRLKLEFITSDCTLQGHFGYAYVDVSSVCNGAVSGAIVCEGDPSSTLSAPFGFASYTWYADATFTTILSTDQFLYLNPPPSTGTVFPVVIVPFPGFGCVDTVYATITSSPKPTAFAGADRSVCTYESTQLGKPPDPGLRYSWSPASDLMFPNSSNPYTRTNLQGVTAFALNVLDPATGCISEDVVVVTPVIIDTVLLVNGDLVFCKDGTRNTSLRIAIPGESVQWYENNRAIAGAINPQYDPRPLSTSAYFAAITKGGCKDSTREVIVTISPDPRASFRPDREVQCAGIPVKFHNSSIIAGNDSMDFTWRLLNGQVFTDKDLVTIFNDPGLQEIRLIARSASGCEDSVSRFFEIIENCHVDIPTAFTPNKDGLNDIFRPTLNGIKGLRRFMIYDRWGNLVFQTSTIGEGWDGKNRGMPLDTGIFIWLIEYDSYERDRIILKGTVTLIR